MTENRLIVFSGATLHALRDRIGHENAVHLGAQLPMLIRGLYYEGWKMAATPIRERHKEAFLEHVRNEAWDALNVDTEVAVHAVFEVMGGNIDPREVTKVISLFPADLRDLWPRPVRP